MSHIQSDGADKQDDTCAELTCPHHGERNRSDRDRDVRAEMKKRVEESVTLWDHFSATINLRIAELQPQYGLVQLNARREACGSMISCDIKRDEFLAAVSSVLDVTITDNERPGGDA